MIYALYDTNVLVDFFEAREPFYREAEAAWAAAERKEVRACVSAVSITTVYYLARRKLGRDGAAQAVADLIRVFDIAAVDGEIIRAAKESGMADFEDAVVAFAGQNAGAGVLVTRDATGFRNSPIPAVAPAGLIGALLAARENP